MLAWILSGLESGLMYSALSIFVGATAVGIRTLRGQRRGRVMRPMVLVGSVALAVLLVAISYGEGWRLPITLRYEILLVAALGLALGVWLLDRRLDQPVLLAVISPTIALLLFFAVLLVPRPGAARPELAIGKFVHIGLALVGLAALTFAAGVALFYLRQIRQLKRDPKRALSIQLLPLEVLDGLNFGAVAIGFPALALGALGGWLFVVRGEAAKGDWWLDPTVIATMTGLLIYGLLLIARTFFGWYGRRIAWLTVAGFVLLVLGFVVAAFCTSPNVMHA